MILIKYQKLLKVCIPILVVVISVGSLFMHDEQQLVAQTSIEANATDRDIHGDFMKLYNNSNFGVSIEYFTNWTQAPESIVAALNQNIEQSLRNQSVNQEVRFITYIFPTNNSLTNTTSKSFVGLAVSNASQYDSNTTIPVVSQYLSEVKQTVNNAGNLTDQTVNVEDIKEDNLGGNIAEGLEYTLGNDTKTLNISTLNGDKTKIISFIYSSPPLDYNRNLPAVLSMKKSMQIQ